MHNAKLTYHSLSLKNLISKFQDLKCNFGSDNTSSNDVKSLSSYNFFCVVRLRIETKGYKRIKKYTFESYKPPNSKACMDQKQAKALTYETEKDKVHGCMKDEKE